MKKFYVAACMVAVLGAGMVSCEEQEIAKEDAIPAEIIAKLENAGFATHEGLSKVGDNYLVEYDILLSKRQIDELASAKSAKGQSPDVEHFYTHNLVNTQGGRTISVYMDPGFDGYMQAAFDEALERYNTLGLTISMQRAQSPGADIDIIAFYENSSTLGMSAGFPDANGDPATPISLNTAYYNSSTQRADAATVIAHEIGHAIGFRHTDYMSRRFSCGGPGGPWADEGEEPWGANHIPGTPKKVNDLRNLAPSYMLACSNNTNRPFTAEDIVALEYLY